MVASPLPPLLGMAVAAAAVFAAGALVWLVLQTFGYRRTPSGNGWKGVTYAFGRGMLPWEKESAGRHLLTLGAGALYHAGVFLALLQLLALILGVDVPQTLAPFLQIFLLVSLLCGVGLLLKRAFLPVLRALSCPDDYVANVVVDLFLLFSLLTAREGAWTNWLLGISIAFFIYVPLGKIRHCVFFFYTRVLFGLFFGKRGVLPHAAGGGER